MYESRNSLKISDHRIHIGNMFTSAYEIGTQQILISKTGANENYPNICAWVDSTGRVQSRAYNDEGYLYKAETSEINRIKLLS